MNNDLPNQENNLFSSELFPEPSTPRATKPSIATSPFSQFCMSSLSPIQIKTTSPLHSPPLNSPKTFKRAARQIQLINFSAIENKMLIQASCVPVEIKVIKELPKVRTRRQPSEKLICCNCQKSRCLKLYCDCFANNQYCNNCSCIDCYNQSEFEEERKNAIGSVLEKKPGAFCAVNSTENDKGCNCKRSGCTKRYCECFQLGSRCGNKCRCIGCNNKEENIKKISKKNKGD